MSLHYRSNKQTKQRNIFNQKFTNKWLNKQTNNLTNKYIYIVEALTMILASTQWLVFSWKSWVEHSIITMRKRTNKPDVTAIITVTEWDSSCRCSPVFVNICCISGKLLFSKKLNSSSHLQSIYLNLTNSAGTSKKWPLILKVKCQLVNLVAFDLSLCRQIVLYSCSGHLFRISGHSSKVYWAINDDH